ncbi:large conductance mechanosensitive channel protein MscL [Candidatus Kaiserbacteria bacterium]|nr:large conductance mechanosensitive channel protein MscL [Candidatus Kaiserbacteria bacterium]
MRRIAELQERVDRNVGGFLSEFWKFAAKGNIFDLAVGVVIGTAFGQVVNSLVADIITPLIALFTNNVDFSEWKYSFHGASLNYGHLIQVSVNFLIVGLSIFIFYKFFSNIRKRLERKESKEPPVPVSTEEKLLSEIRDILKEQKHESHTP